MGTDNLCYPVEEVGKAIRKLVFGRVAIQGTELLAKMRLDAGIQDSRD
jgi:hypothetical protein